MRPSQVSGLGVADELRKMPSWEETQILLSPEAIRANGTVLSLWALDASAKGFDKIPITIQWALNIAEQLRCLADEMEGK